MTTLDIEQPSAGTPTLLERFDRSRLAAVLVFALVAAGFWLMNFLTPYQGDDYSFNFISEAEKCTHRVESVGDLFSSWGYHYMHGNGRFADDGCVRPTHFLGKPIFNFLNTFVFVAFAALVAKLGAGAAGKIRASSLVLVAALWGFLMPIPWQSTLWQTGACNYLWATTAALLWIFLFEKAHAGKWTDAGAAKLAALFLFSLVCAWFHEGVAPVVALCAGIYGLVNFKKLTRAEKVLAVGFFVGAALVVFSPGIILRATSGNSMSVPPLTASNIAKSCFGIAAWSKVSVCVGAVLVMLAARSRGFLFKFVRAEWFFLAVWITALGYNVFLRGAGGERNCFFHEAVAVVLALKLFGTWRSGAFKSALVAGAGAAALVGFACVVPEMAENFSVHEKFAEAARNSTGTAIAADLPEGDSNSRFIVRQTPGDANFGDHHNLAISRYFGRQERVFIAPQSFWDSICERDEFCVPANEFSPGWYSSAKTPFAVRKILSPEDEMPSPARIKYVHSSAPESFLAERLALPLRKFVTGRGEVFETDFGDLDVPRVLELPSGKYFVVPLSKRTAYSWKLIPTRTTGIRIEENKN